MADRLKPLRLIHTSDVHLESDTHGAGERGDAFRERVRGAFRGVVDIANQKKADLLLIVGDLFDSSRVGAEALDFAMSTIARAAMPVVMIPGNHDAHDERSIYAGMAPSALPSNLHLILEVDGLTLDFPELHARLWGRALSEHSPDYRPLLGIPPAAPDRWNIALAHGLYTDGGESHRSSPITPAEIEATGYHYIALGHIHLFGDVSHGSTRAFYCGTPAPLYSGSDAGWVAEVNCRSGEPLSVERVPVETEQPAALAQS
jgi:DNA repair exonuclease SbcCD nuclease subunit